MLEQKDLQRFTRVQSDGKPNMLIGAGGEASGSQELGQQRPLEETGAGHVSQPLGLLPPFSSSKEALTCKCQMLQCIAAGSPNNCRR